MKMTNLKKCLLAFVAIVSLWAAGAPPAWGQVQCSEATLQAIKQLGLQADARKAAKILTQLDPTGALGAKFGDLLDDIVLGRVIGGPVIPDALPRMMRMVQNYADPTVFSDTATSLQAMGEAFEEIWNMRQTFGKVPEGIFNRTTQAGDVIQPTAWLENASGANGLGQLFEIKGYRNLVNQGVLRADQAPAFGKVFPTELGDVECDVLVAFVCVDFKFTNSANFNLDGPGKAAQAIIDQEFNQMFYAVSPSASSAPAKFQDAVTQAGAAAKFGPNTLVIIDGGTF
jgi:hypothetical protein